MGAEPRRLPPSAQVSARMSSLARRDTKPEMDVRRALHAAGLRYRVQLPVPGNARRTVDIAFTGARLAVFVDGCFWHGCPEHGTWPKANSDWWTWKLSRNQARDADTDQLLNAQGWRVLRFWEHEEPAGVADLVETVYRSRAGPPRAPRAPGSLTR